MGRSRIRRTTIREPRALLSDVGINWDLLLDAQFTDSQINVAGGIANWYDKSGNDRNAVQATAGLRPTLTMETKLNNQLAVTLDGSDAMASTFGATLTPPTTFFVVAHSTTDTNTFFFDGIDSTNRNALFITATPLYALFAVGGQIDGSAPDTDPHIFRCVVNGASSSLFIDGVSDATGNAGSANLTGLNIGSANGQAAGFLDGSIALIAAVNRLLTTNEIGIVENNLSIRYGISI